MKKYLTNWRYYVLCALWVVCILGIFAIPGDDLPAFEWTLLLVLSKIVGIVAGYLCLTLTNYWEDNELL